MQIINFYPKKIEIPKHACLKGCVCVGLKGILEVLCISIFNILSNLLLVAKPPLLPSLCGGTFFFFLFFENLMW